MNREELENRACAIARIIMSKSITGDFPLDFESVEKLIIDFFKDEVVGSPINRLNEALGLDDDNTD